MATNFPSSLDSSTQQPTIASSDEMDDSGKEHDVVHTNHSGAIIALETKLGSTDSNPVADAVLMGTGSGTSAWDTSPTFKGAVTVGVDDTGHDVKFFGATSGKYMEWDESADQLNVVGSLNVTGNTQMTGTLSVGVDDTGHDVIFYGATTGNAWFWWDESDDALKLGPDSPLFANGRIQTGQQTFTQKPWANSTIALGNYGAVGSQGSYRTALSWNFERGTDSAYHHLDVNSYPQAGLIEIGASGINLCWEADYENNHTDAPTTVLIMDADAIYPATTNVTDLGTTAKKFQIVYGNYFYGTQGSAAYPAYVFDGDGNTGIWSSGADTINWSTAGVERGELTSGGLWYFGTSSQHVKVNYNNNERLVLHEDGTGRPYMAFYNRKADASVVRKGYIGYPEATSDSSDIYIRSDLGNINMGQTKFVGSCTVGTGSGDLMMHGANGLESFRAVTSVVRAANIVNLTTSSAANVRINSSNNSMYMSTSSGRYKTDIEDLEDTYADKLLDLRPVWFRSLCKDDPDEYSYYGLIAEEVAKIEPRLATYGPSNDCACPPEEDDPHHVEHHLEGCLIPEGVQYDRLVPHLINLAKRQDATIKGLEARVASLEG